MNLKILSLFYGWLFLFFSFLVLVFIGYSWFFGYSIYIYVWNFLVVNVFDCVSIVIFMDYYGLFFLLVLFLIVSSVMFFCKDYMIDEVMMSRFLIIVNLFVGSMVVLILFPGFFSFLLGWDGLGLTSFILVAWFSCSSSSSASLKTFLMNRFGDGLFIVGLVFLFGSSSGLVMKSFDDLTILFTFFISLFLVFACFTKSAQFPFSSWLPVAMAAPTPVSSLVHSSTLVTAGLYMLYRMSFFFSSKIMFFFCLMGLSTLFIASFSAVFEVDVKKVVAFSTLSQLGFLLFVLGLGLKDYFFFYMLVHALFKALMFISVGLYLVIGFHNQDGRSLLNMWKSSPLFFFSFFFSVITLCGFPLMSSFVLKDSMLKLVSLVFSVKWLFSWLFFYSMILTVIYSFRLFLKSSLMETSFLSISMSSNGVWYLSILMVSSFVFSVAFMENYFLVFLNLDFVDFLIVMMMILFGFFISLSLKKKKFVLMKKNLYFVLSFLKKIFFLVFLNSSMKNLLVSGSNLVSNLDSGFITFRFSFLKSFIDLFVKKMFVFFSWMIMFFFSLTFLLFMCLI